MIDLDNTRDSDRCFTCGELIARIFIVFPVANTLVDRDVFEDAVDTDIAVAAVRQASFRQGETITVASLFRGHNVETAKSKCLIVDNRTAHGHGFPIEFTDKKPIGIGLIKGLGVMETGVPAFASGPFDGHGHIVRGHAADLICVCRHL